ncbi:hypothetical protein [Winogradskyella sp. PE311]|uniref:hypothetical protein n=1 Tax=Winogradskyella sp. PE311 TaxID=3366943 RepID=UPI00397ED237
MSLPLNFESLIVEAETLNLYEKLIIQLNKDLLLANIDLEFDVETPPTSLKFMLRETVFNLIQNKFTEYLNFLYLVDVSELKLSMLNENNTNQFSEEVTFLILQREWQKVWYKAKYS